MLLVSLFLSFVSLSTVARQCTQTKYERREWRELSTDEQQEFFTAVNKLKFEVPSQMGLENRYDDFNHIHFTRFVLHLLNIQP
jgi:predicted Fe-S protein YdhL (DUF1289 family)